MSETINPAELAWEFDHVGIRVLESTTTTINTKLASLTIHQPPKSIRGGLPVLASGKVAYRERSTRTIVVVRLASGHYYIRVGFHDFIKERNDSLERAIVLAIQRDRLQYLEWKALGWEKKERRSCLPSE